MFGIAVNVLGLLIVVLFVQLVDWSLWASIPVGILIAAIAAIFAGYLKGVLAR